MGKTSRPLKMLVSQELLDAAPEHFEKLRAQGHTIDTLPAGYDLIAGEECWYMPMSLWKYWDVSIKAARKRRYPKAGDDE